MGQVNITLANGGLGGTTQTDDGVCAFCLTGVSEGGGYTLGTPILINGMTALATAGITAANNPFAVKNVSEFYAQAGDGAELYLMLVAHTVTVASMCDNTNANGLKKLLNYAQGRVRLVGAMSDDAAIIAGSGTVTVTNGINADCYTAITNLQSMLNSYATVEVPMRGLVGGTSFTGTFGALTDQTTNTCNRVALVIGDTVSGKGAALGLTMGKLAAVPVHQKISWVEQGAIEVPEIYFGTTTLEASGNAMAAADSIGVISFKTYPQKASYYFTGDHTCTSGTDDYCYMVRGRVIDKAQIIAYGLLVNDVDATVATVPGTGFIDPGFAANEQKSVENAINTAMTAAGNNAGCTCYVNPNQNIVSSGQMTVVLSVDALGYSSDIEVTLGLAL